jgi:hypothetical protein
MIINLSVIFPFQIYAFDSLSGFDQAVHLLSKKEKGDRPSDNAAHP